MTEAAVPDTSLEIARQITLVLRSNAETQKFISEQRELASAQQRLIAEQQKLMAIAVKFTCDRALAPWQIGLSLNDGGRGVLRRRSRLHQASGTVKRP